MKIQLKLIVVLPVGWTHNNNVVSQATEHVAWSDDQSEYGSDYYDQTIPFAINSACKSLGLDNVSDLRPFSPEVSIYFFSDDDCRPALHINAETIALMCDAGCAFDFDPYIYS